jgi:3-phenylpropionate/trans-cinnamate dioxygenase ferredoxin reductase subunit
MSNETIVIVGAGHAGGRAAQAMRAAGFEGSVILVGEEAYEPYERPPLSKELLQSDDGLERARLHDPAWYEDNDIELLTNARATAIDTAAKTVTLFDGGTLSYDKLLLTTGARVRELPLSGADLPEVHYLRDYNDTKEIRARLDPDARVVVIGGGFIGLECAASARSRGCAVTVLEVADRLMGRAVAPEIGKHFEEIHRSQGVDLRLGVKIAGIDGYGKVASVVLEDDEPVPADVVVIGIGILPNVELAEEAGIACENGITVDEFGRTSDPNVWAAGDVANQPNAFLGRRVRLESYQNAQDQAMAVARNMVGDEQTPYEDSLWVWTDQYDVNLQMLGMPEGYDELVWRGDPDAGAFTLFYMKGGKIVAVNTVNSGRDMGACKRLIATGKTFDAAQLADPAVKLIKLAKG